MTDSASVVDGAAAGDGAAVGDGAAAAARVPPAVHVPRVALGQVPAPHRLREAPPRAQGPARGRALALEALAPPPTPTGGAERWGPTGDWEVAEGEPRVSCRHGGVDPWSE